MFEFGIVVHHPKDLDEARINQFRKVVVPGLISHLEERCHLTDYDVTVTSMPEERSDFWISMSELPEGEDPDWVCHLVQEVAHHELVNEDDHETVIEVETPAMAGAPAVA